MHEFLTMLDGDSIRHGVYIVGSMALSAIGVYGLLAKRHLLKLLISISIMEIAVYLLFVGLSGKAGTTAPIISDGVRSFAGAADPVPQALTLTAIVIGLAITALGVSMAVLYRRLGGSGDVNEMTDLKG